MLKAQHCMRGVLHQRDQRGDPRGRAARADAGQAAGVAGERVLDIAAGSGNASARRPRAGAEVVASDLCALSRPVADNPDPRITWTEADAEALPFDDGAFDAVPSAIAATFAPHHQQSADELVRACRPGGPSGSALVPHGFIGQMFATTHPFEPATPAGAAAAAAVGRDGRTSRAAR